MIVHSDGWWICIIKTMVLEKGGARRRFDGAFSGKKNKT